jgi:hypothetical protein
VYIPPTQELGNNFTANFQKLCTGDAINTTDCGSLVYRTLSENALFTDYISRQNDAIDDATSGAMRDWQFIVSEFVRLHPLIKAYEKSGYPQLQMLVNQVEAEYKNFSAYVQPNLQWATDTLNSIRLGNDRDILNLTRQVDYASQDALHSALQAARIRPNTRNRFAESITDNLNEFWDKEFPRVKALASSQEKTLSDKMDLLKTKIAKLRKNLLTDNLNVLRVNETILGNYIGNNSVLNRISSVEHAFRESMSSYHNRLLGLSQYVTNGTTNASIDISRRPNKVQTNLTGLLSRFGNFATNEFQSYNDQFNSSLDSLGETIDKNIVSAINISMNAKRDFETRFQNISDSLLGEILSYQALLDNTSALALVVRGDNTTVNP